MLQMGSPTMDSRCVMSSRSIKGDSAESNRGSCTTRARVQAGSGYILSGALYAFLRWLSSVIECSAAVDRVELSRAVTLHGQNKIMEVPCCGRWNRFSERVLLLCS